MFATDDKNVTENRRLFVGGSDVPILLGISKYKSQYELAKEKVGIVPTVFEGNEYAVYGQMLEPKIRDYINAVNEINFQPDTAFNKDICVRGNCDGVDYEEQLLLEIKTHGKNPTMNVYKAQIQLYLYLFDLPAAWLALYERPENFDAEFDSERLKIEVIHRDEDLIQNILQQVELFWKRCEALKANPELSEVDFYSISLKEESNEIAIIANQVEVLEQQLASFKEIETQHKALKEKLYALMMEHKVKSFETNQLKITVVLPTTSTSIDSKKLKEELPEVAAKYSKTSSKSGYVNISKLKEAK